jgi:D-glycero-D-manno-heptose 1,7-bisphosphate phosphatase
MRRAIFLDRDGVLIEDVHLLTRPEQVVLLPGVPEALRRFAAAGFKLIVVSNQTVISRGLATEAEVDVVNKHMDALLQKAGSPPLTASSKRHVAATSRGVPVPQAATRTNLPSRD